MSRNYNAIIVDDERLARKELISMLKDFPDINIIGEAGNVDSALDIIKKTKPDVIFLDIQMPGSSGFTLLDKINQNIKIIFVTAFDEYAIRAFEVNALDYLLKPVTPLRLKRAVERLFQNSSNKQIFSRKLAYEDNIFLLINSQMRFIKISSIISVNASKDYTEIITSDSIKGLTSKAMREWEIRLPENHFIRIHRSTIINLNYIQKIDKWFNHSYQVYLKGIEQPYTMSRRYASVLKEKLG